MSFGEIRVPWQVGAGVVVAVCALIFLAGASTPTSDSVTAADLQPLVDPVEGYVTSDSCRSCHPREFASWHDSFHRTMTQKASVETVLGDFDDVVLGYHGWTYRLFEEDSLHFFEAARGDERYRRPIVQTTGSHHIQTYWFPTGEGRALELFPYFWVIPEQRWLPRESVFLQPTVSIDKPLDDPDALLLWQRDRAWNHGCIHCHTTDARPGFPQLDTRVSELGIACEACHGPAEEHVGLNRSPLRRYQLHFAGSGDETMVQPTRLTNRAGSAVCGSCHSVWEAFPDDVKETMNRGFDYQPGDSLVEDRVLVRPSQGQLGRSGEINPGKFWSDGQLRVSGREYTALLDSPCIESEDFGCSSCHQLHPETTDPRSVEEWRDDQLHLGMRSNTACVDCHAEFADPVAVSQHSRHDATSSGSQCMNCHMTYTTYGLLKAMRSHEITSPTVQATLDSGRPNACNQCHLDQSLAWTAEYLHDWYEQPLPDALDDYERAVPATAVAALRGDAGERVLMAWTLGWEPALEVSGRHWTMPLLGQLLLDPYDAVRIVAERSLRRNHPNFVDFPYDPMAPERDRVAAVGRLLEHWRTMPAPDGKTSSPADLIDDPSGVIGAEAFTQLLADRDHRIVMLTE